MSAAVRYSRWVLDPQRLPDQQRGDRKISLASLWGPGGIYYTPPSATLPLAPQPVTVEVVDDDDDDDPPIPDLEWSDDDEMPPLQCPDCLRFGDACPVGTPCGRMPAPAA